MNPVDPVGPGAAGRAAALASAVGAAALVVGSLGLGALPSTAATGAARAAPVEVAVPASGARLACPGAPLAAAGASASASASPQGRGPAAASATTGLLATGAGASLTASVLRERRAGEGAVSSVRPVDPTQGAAVGDLLRVVADPTATAAGTAAVLAAGPVAGGAPLLAGATTSVAISGDLRGLVATTCVVPAEENWLVGGSTGVGRSTRLVLAGTGETATTVDVTVLTAEGPQQPGALQGLSLGAGEQRSVLLEGVLDGVADDAASSGGDPLAVRVTSSAGPVAAWLVEGVRRGLVPGGQEVVVPTAPPSTSQLVPGVVVAGPAPAVLRVANPGSEPVVARFSVIDGAGSSVPSGATPATAVPAGSVVDVELPSLPSGGVGLAVEADGPVLAAARTDSSQASTGAPGAGDIAWTAATGPLTAPTLVALPPGTGRGAGAGGAPPQARLVVTSGGVAAAVDVAIVGADGRTGAARRVTLPATTTTAADVDDLVAAAGGTGTPQALLLTPVEGSGGVVAAITSRAAAGSGGDLVSAFPASPGAQARTTLSVTVTSP